MARVTLHDLDSVPDHSADALARHTERMGGKTLNIFGAMANSPTVLNLYTAVEDLLAEHSTLDGRTREALHLTIANINECGYCQAAYTMTAKRQGFSDEQALQIRRGEVDGDAELTALLRIAREAATHKGEVSDDAWDAATDAGWDEAAILDAYSEVIRTTLTNWFNHLVHTDQDLPEAPALD